MSASWPGAGTGRSECGGVHVERVDVGAVAQWRCGDAELAVEQARGLRVRRAQVFFSLHDIIQDDVGAAQRLLRVASLEVRGLEHGLDAAAALLAEAVLQRVGERERGY